MRLSELNAYFIGAGGEGVYTHGPNGEMMPAPERHGVGVIMDCPCGKCPPIGEGGGLYVPFANPLDGFGPFDRKGWQRTGDTIETLTLSPSVLRSRDRGGCGWHGFIENGAVRTV